MEPADNLTTQANRPETLPRPCKENTRILVIRTRIDHCKLGVTEGIETFGTQLPTDSGHLTFTEATRIIVKQRSFNPYHVPCMRAWQEFAALDP